MKKHFPTVMACLVVAGLAVVLTALSTSNVEAKAETTSVDYGLVYPISNFDDWEKGFPYEPLTGEPYVREASQQSKEIVDQMHWDIDHTHFPYVTQSSTPSNVLAFQYALQEAADKGWKIVSIDGEARVAVVSRKVVSQHSR